MFKQLSYNLIFRIVGFIIGFFLSVVIARKLGNNEYGIFAIYLTISLLISGLGIFGFPNYIIKNISITKTFNNKILFVLLNSSFVVIVLILIFIVFEKDIYSLFKINEFQLSNNLYFFGYILFATLNVLLRSVFEGFYNSQSSYFIKEVLGRLFKLIPLLIIPISLNNVFVIFFIVEVCVLIIFILSILIKYKVDIDIKKQFLTITDIKKIYRYTFPLFATTLVLLFNGQIVKLLLGSFESAKYVGYYQLSLNFVALMIIGLNIQDTVLKPYFSKFFHKDSFQEIQEYYVQSSKILTLIFLPVGLFFLGIPKLFLMFYGHDYYEASIILQLVIISSIVNISTGSNYPILIMSSISHKELWANILNFFVVIIFGTLFIKIWGYIGAGLVLIVSQAVVNIYRIIVLNKKYRLKPFNNLKKVYLLLFLSIIIVFLLSNYFNDSIIYFLPAHLFFVFITTYLFIKIEFSSGEIKNYYYLLRSKIFLDKSEQ